MHIAAYNPHSTLYTFKLLADYGANINQLDDDGNSVLSKYLNYATKIDGNIVKYLVRAGNIIRIQSSSMLS